MAFNLPPAGPRYDRKNENQARRITEQAFASLFSRLESAEEQLAALPPGGGPIGPSASFTHNETGRQVTFTDTSVPGDVAITGWLWDFGDGLQSAAQNPTHTYANDGTFSVTLTVTDANTLSDATTPIDITVAAPGGATILRAGVFDLVDHVGEGPGGDTGEPIYRVGHWNPHAEGVANIPGILAQAESQDIILHAVTAGSAQNYGADVGAFDLGRYEDQLDVMAAIPAFNAAMASGRIHAYIGDEPNRTALWGNSFTPTLWNAAARANKDRWPGCLTFGRLTPVIMAEGWSGHAGLATYDALDYGWLQYAAVHRKQGQGVAAALVENKQVAAQLNMGVTFGLNLANAGYRTNLDGVVACWDYANNGSSNGIVIGEPGVSPFTEGQQVPCSQVGTVPTSQNLMANPALIRRVADVGAADPDVPYVIYWKIPPGGGSDVLVPYFDRADWAAAFDYAIAVGNARTVWNGLRTPKP